jgi:toxin YoeB
LPSKKKQSKKSPAQPKTQAQKTTGRSPVFEIEFREDLGWWYRNDIQKAYKVLDLVEDILKHPFTGIGKPESLKYLDPDTWSRRIDQEHRVVYRVTHDQVGFLQARYHY